VSKVGDKWPELLPVLADVVPNAFDNILPLLCAQIHSTRTKPAERIRLIQMLEDIFNSDLFSSKSVQSRTLDINNQLWKAFLKLFNDDDLKVREGNNHYIQWRPWVT